MNPQPRTHRRDHRGLSLAYHAWGDPEGEPLLCLHGFMDHGRSYQFFVEHLGPGYYVVAPDMRGHGDSGWVGAGGYYHFYDYFDDVHALVEHLGWARFGVVGHSMGGSVAAGVTAMMSERVHALVMLEGMGPPFSVAGDLPDRLVAWTRALRKASCSGDVPARRLSRRAMPDLAAAAAKLRVVNPRLTEDRALALATTFTEPSSDGSGVVWRQDPLHRTPSAKPYLFEEAQSLWSRIRCPVLSMFGAESPWAALDVTDRHAELAEVLAVEVPGAGHNLHHDRPDLVAAATAAWLRAAPADLPAELVRRP